MRQFLTQGAWFAVFALLPARAAGEQMSAAQAKQEFAAAQALYQQNRCSEALPKLERLVAATDSPNARLYVARCLRQLGRLPEAYDAMTQTLRAADARASTDEYYAETRNAAAAERAALESKIARLVLAAADPPEGLSIELNGAALALERLGETIAVEPGHVRVTASAPGRARFVRELDLKAGASVTVAIALGAQGAQGTQEPAGTRARAEPSPLAPETPARDEAKTGGFGLRGWGFVALGVGVAGMATFAVAGTMANKRFDSLNEDCGGGPCPASKRSDVEGGQRFDTIANVGLGVGAAGLVAGTILILVGGPNKHGAASGLVLSPGRSGASVGYAGRF
jgi:hypothetical protein